MAVNKVIFGTDVQIDLTEDTVTADKLLEGVTAHAANGEQITGTLVSNKIIFLREVGTELLELDIKNELESRGIYDVDYDILTDDNFLIKFTNLTDFSATRSGTWSSGNYRGQVSYRHSCSYNPSNHILTFQFYPRVVVSSTAGTVCSANDSDIKTKVYLVTNIFE